ncbi:hypothetical protein ABID21_004613 [Pseudorhizobium tarimense]|uniref:Uncharacterized protein n=1 Tax=Pseudorhizobium tarimense TaxID=1079109 RepID=A0ABV2HD51_9HYPH|nr:hypothetical protein [Pseudorhizobium tarimense]MCJ8521548.1 hypothetical protein [Pseudorhizobium tarimense]
MQQSLAELGEVDLIALGTGAAGLAAALKPFSHSVAPSEFVQILAVALLPHIAPAYESVALRLMRGFPSDGNCAHLDTVSREYAINCHGTSEISACRGTITS